MTLEADEKYDHEPLYKVSLQELDANKRYLPFHLAKGFIWASSAAISSPVLFIKKSGKQIRFYVNYWRLYAITKKDYYLISLISLIKEKLARLRGAKYFMKIDLCQAFYQIKLSEDSEELITFLTKFGAFKYFVILFGLCNGPALW